MFHWLPIPKMVCARRCFYWFSVKNDDLNCRYPAQQHEQGPSKSHYLRGSPRRVPGAISIEECWFSVEIWDQISLICFMIFCWQNDDDFLIFADQHGACSVWLRVVQRRRRQVRAQISATMWFGTMSGHYCEVQLKWPACLVLFFLLKWVGLHRTYQLSKNASGAPLQITGQDEIALAETPDGGVVCFSFMLLKHAVARAVFQQHLPLSYTIFLASFGVKHVFSPYFQRILLRFRGWFGVFAFARSRARGTRIITRCVVSVSLIIICTSVWSHISSFVAGSLTIWASQHDIGSLTFFPLTVWCGKISYGAI